MSNQVEFFFDYVSTATYIAYQIGLPRIRAAGAKIVWKPMLLGAVFEATGNSSPISVPAKGKWMFDDLSRTVAKHDIPFTMNPAFPINTVTALRGAFAAEELGAETYGAYNDAMFAAMWQQARDISKPEILMEVLHAAGLPADKIAARVQEQAIKDKLRATTDDAIARGVFGAPTFFVNGEMHWGSDRVDQVIEALDKAK